MGNRLADWESAESHSYGAPLLTLSSGSGATFIVSDLHLGAGLARDGTVDGSENFFADTAFRRFLDWAHARAGSAPATLIVNGDVVDFLRITTLPASEDEFIEWSATLAQLGIAKKAADLRASITKKETKYGLKTDDYKSVFKLSVAAKGHRPLFDALAHWIARGHRLIIIKGNHDLEWYWRAVRDRLRVILAGNLVLLDMAPDLAQALSNVLPNLIFADHSLLIDQQIYVEHGHRFDRYSHILGSPVLPGTTELNIPFGSFINRYLLNVIELHYPFIDNVRPTQNLLPLLIRERFFLALKVFFCHVPLLIHTIPKRYYRYLLARVLPLAMALGGPIALLIWNLRRPLKEALTGQGGSVLSQSLSGQLVLPAVSYFLGRIAAYLQLREPSSLNEAGRQVLLDNPQYRIAIFGHTHNPDQLTEGDRHFCNTGTWIPVVETSTGDLRTDLTFTFLEIGRDLHGAPVIPFLQRWNDEGGRADLLRVIRN